MNDSPPPNNTPPAAGGSDENRDGDDRVAELIVRYLNDAVSEVESQHLSRSLDGNPQRQALFVRLARLHGLMSELGRLTVAERRSDVWNLLDDQDDTAAPAGAAAVSLHDAIVQTAIREADLGESDDDRPHRPPVVEAQTYPVHPARGVRWWATAAVLALSGVIFTAIPVVRHDLATHAPASKPGRPMTPLSTPVPAVITASAAAAIDDSPMTWAGTTLAAGQAIDLTAGAIEITFDSTAVVAVTAPARFRIVDRNRMALERGSITAHVPPSGVGFRVDGADMTVIDQGTDFGLRPGGRGAATELHVFKGAVDVTAATAGSTTLASAAPLPVRVSGGNAVVCAAGRGSPRPTVYAPEAFVRSIDEYRMTAALHGTGTGVAFKSPDPKWSLVADPGGTLAEPRRLYAIEMRPAYFFAASERSKWVSLAPEISDAPSGKFTFRTTVVLPDFAPGTAAVTGTWGVDDKLADVIVNGVSTAEANADMLGQVSRTQPITWALRGAPWKPGSNQVDVIVSNNVVPPGVQNQTALNVAFTAAYAPPVRRASDGISTVQEQLSPTTSAAGRARQ